MRGHHRPSCAFGIFFSGGEGAAFCTRLPMLSERGVSPARATKGFAVALGCFACPRCNLHERYIFATFVGANCVRPPCFAGTSIAHTHAPRRRARRPRRAVVAQPPQRCHSERSEESSCLGKILRCAQDDNAGGAAVRGTAGRVGIAKRRWMRRYAGASRPTAGLGTRCA